MIDPAEVGRHCGFSPDKTVEFCAETLTGVNAHNEAMLLRALQCGNYDDAIKIVLIDKAMRWPPLFGPEVDQVVAERDAFMKKYADAKKSTEL